MRRGGTVVCALLISRMFVGCDAPEVGAGGDLAAEGSTPIDVDGFRFYQGENGEACTASPYNCKLRAAGGNRVATAEPDDGNTWAVDANVPILDGHGSLLGFNQMPRTAFVFGQSREFGGNQYVFATWTSNGSPGWLLRSRLVEEDAFVAALGEATAVGAGLATMECYQIANTHDPGLELKRTVYDSRQAHERASEYLPIVREDDERRAVLLFNVPGYTLGGAAIDLFPAGTKFQRLDVPTGQDGSGPASLEISLFTKDPQGRYRQASGKMVFVYGYVRADDGTKRNGWMAHQALIAAMGCP